MPLLLEVYSLLINLFMIDSTEMKYLYSLKCIRPKLDQPLYTVRQRFSDCIGWDCDEPLILQLSMFKVLQRFSKTS